MPTPKLMVKRARPVDAAAIADLVSAATGGRLNADEDAVIDRLGTRGYYVAHAGSLVGLVGWTAENLVARIEDFLVHPIDMRPTAGRELLNAVEDAARELQCEASLLMVPRNASQAAVKFFESCGYAYQPLDEMPEAWREAAQGVITEDRFVLVKQIRSDLIHQPI